VQLVCARSFEPERECVCVIQLDRLSEVRLCVDENCFVKFSEYRHLITTASKLITAELFLYMLKSIRRQINSHNAGCTACGCCTIGFIVIALVFSLLVLPEFQTISSFQQDSCMMYDCGGGYHSIRSSCYATPYRFNNSFCYRFPTHFVFFSPHLVFVLSPNRLSVQEHASIAAAPGCALGILWPT
jgi:hypothetical protein